MFDFFAKIFTRFVNVFKDLALLIYSTIPEIPSITVSLDTLDLVTQAAVACKYFLPLDTIALLCAATVKLFAFKIVVSFLRSEFGQKVLGIIIDKLTDFIGVVLKFI